MARHMHWITLGIGLLLGYFVLPGVLGWARGIGG